MHIIQNKQNKFLFALDPNKLKHLSMHPSEKLVPSSLKFCSPRRNKQQQQQQEATAVAAGLDVGPAGLVAGSAGLGPGPAGPWTGPSSQGPGLPAWWPDETPLLTVLLPRLAPALDPVFCRPIRSGGRPSRPWHRPTRSGGQSAGRGAGPFGAEAGLPGHGASRLTDLIFFLAIFLPRDKISVNSCRGRDSAALLLPLPCFRHLLRMNEDFIDLHQQYGDRLPNGIHYKSRKTTTNNKQIAP
jgi:hypothetical protein